MASDSIVIWSPSAKNDLENITGYLMREWGRKVVARFLNKMDSIISQIIINPRQYPLFNSALNIRRCVVTKQNTLFYRVRNGRIEIIRIYDTRQDPGKLKILF